MKCLFGFTFLLLMCAFASAQQTLIRNGASDYVIVVAADAIPAEQTAARELQEHVKQITGFTLPIKSEAETDANAAQILIGAGPRVRALLPQQNWSALGADGIAIKTFGNKLVLAGGRPRGTLYAVYEFLESLGCRWWTPTENFIPQKNTVDTPALNIIYAPPFSYREHFTTSVSRDPIFATRMRENGHHQPQKTDWGGHYSILGFVHTFNTLLPPSKYQKDHPDWFGEGAQQPCVTNEVARSEIIKNALEWIRKNPEAGIISVSQNDNVKYCRCANCLAANEREGSPAGPLLELVNAVADEVKRDFPGFLVETLAYQYTRKPPKTVRPRDNVVIRLCSIEADFSRPLDSDANAAFRDDIIGWKQIAPRLYIWDYITNFSNSIWPHPNLRVLGPNLRFFAQNNVIGMFEQGDYYSGGTGDFPQLRTWLISRLMWNPQQDENKLIDEFLRGYYGAAAPHLRDYLDLMQGAFARTGQKLSTFQGNHSWMTLEVMNEATRHFKTAEIAVQNDAVLSLRVRRARLPLDHVWITRYGPLRRQAIAQNIAFEGPQDLKGFGENFLQANEEFKTLNWQENGPWKDYVPSLRRKFEVTNAPLPVELGDVKPNSDIIDAQDNIMGLIWRGKVTEWVKDEKASDGFAARIIGTSKEWAVQWHPDDDAEYLQAGPWHCYIAIRTEPKEGAPREGGAFTCGIYDSNEKKNIAHKSYSLADTADGNYRLIDFGIKQIKPGTFFWAAPAANANVTAIYVDRIIMVREPK